MARLLMIGKVAQVELTVDDEGYAIATCVKHRGPSPLTRPEVRCDWTLKLDNMIEMIHTPYAEAHGDRGTR